MEPRTVKQKPSKQKAEPDAVKTKKIRKKRANPDSDSEFSDDTERARPWNWRLSSRSRQSGRAEPEAVKTRKTRN
jgi:hypothetical protein